MNAAGPASETSSRVSRDKAATRERILGSAIAVFGERGYQATSMDEIARRSGSSKGGVYFHFANKQAIFEALIGELVSLLEAEVREAIGRHHGALARVDAALTVAIRTFSAHRGLTRLLLVEANGLGHPFDQELRAARGVFLEVIESYLRHAVEEGAIAPLDTRVAACVWLGAINEVVVQWLYAESPPESSLEATLPALRSALLGSIGVGDHGSGRQEGG
ncbi:MAG TPA: TetR/AcrR family transcriptional regulator [Chloroflexota bacterium]|nr:TetR/AcrR family transcriptional regulator [Chloroflexota bacterium]